VVLDDEKEVLRQLKAGVCVSITLPSEIVKQYKKSYESNVSKTVRLDTLTTSIEQNNTQTVEAGKERPADGPPSTLNTLSLDKQWILSTLVARYKQNLCFHEPKAFGFCPLTTQPIFNKSFLKNEIIERIGLFFAMTTSIHF
jgi:hypothetical protein